LGGFVIPILMGAEDAFGAGQVNVFLCDARGDHIREQHHLKALLNRRVDGIIVVSRQTDPAAHSGTSCRCRSSMPTHHLKTPKTTP
jgi:LacI family transcriptional regulator